MLMCVCERRITWLKMNNSIPTQNHHTKMQSFLIKSSFPPVVLEVIISVGIILATVTAVTQYRRLTRKFEDLRQKHVFITGGSKGL